jgi:WD40 repeat protein
MGDRFHAALILGGVVALALAVAAAVLGMREIRESRASARVAESRALAASALSVADRSPELAALLAVESFSLTADDPPGDSYEARDALVTALQRLSYLRAILRGHDGPVSAVSFNPQGTLVASGGEDGTVRVWNIRRRTELSRLTGHRGTVTAVAFSPDGTLLASAGSDSVVRLWNVERGTLAGELRGHRGGIQQVVFSPDGRKLASAGDNWLSSRPDSTVRLWDIARREQIGATLRVAASGVGFNRDGSKLTVVNMVGWITEHDARRPRPYHDREYDTSYTEYTQSRFTGGPLVALSGESGIEVWDVTGRRSRPVRILGDVWPPRTVGAGRERIGVGDYVDGTLTYWDTAQSYHAAEGTLDPGSSLSFSNGGIEALDFDETGNWVAVGGADGTVRIATLGDPWARLLRFDSRKTRFDEPIRSRDGRWLARLEETDDWSRTRVAIRDSVDQDKTVETLATRSSAIAFHPDGKRVALLARDGRLRYWDIGRGAPVGDLLPSGFPPKGVSTIAFSPDGHLIAAYGWDGRYGWDPGFVLWDVARWAPIGEPIPVCCSGGADERLSFDTRNKTFIYRDEAGGVAIDPLLVSSDLERWRRRICALVGRNLTGQEWRRYLPDRPYRETCHSPG